MNRENRRFWGILAGSMLVHLGLYAFVFALPAPNQPEMQIYRVNVIHAPQHPQARKLTLSTKPISASRQTPKPTPSPPPAPPVLKAAAAPSAPLAAPSAPPAAAASAPLAAPSAPPAAAASAPLAAPSAPLAAPSAAEAPGPSPMEQTRDKVARLQKQQPRPAPPVSVPNLGLPRSSIALRSYQATVQKEVQKKYQFPGGFDKTLSVRVRITIARDGSVRDVVFLERSGNPHFDRAALLSIRRIRLPSIPAKITEETLSQVVLFRP